MPEVTRFWYSVATEMRVSKTEVDHLMVCLQRHYDRKCRTASERGGFIYGWRNRFEHEDDTNFTTVLVTAHEMGTVCKILETYGHDKVLRAEFNKILTRMGEASEKINGPVLQGEGS